MCIFIEVGEYNESVTIGHEKTNLILVSEGIRKTTIISNAETLEYTNLIGATLCKFVAIFSFSLTVYTFMMSAFKF